MVHLEPDAPIRPSVLLVDDTPANLLALSAVLSPLAVRLVEARSGREALQRIAEQAFAVVLLDVQMPGMDGFEVAERMRATAHGRDVPIVFLTAIHRDEIYARTGYAKGAADYITKPFDAEILRARVKAFVDLFRQREEVRRAQVAVRTSERDDAVRRLVAFERISTAALERTDIDSFLRELLDIFLGATDAVDTAAVLLVQGNELRMRASAGKPIPAAVQAASERIGEGFAGRIAATRQPWEVPAGSSPIVASPWLAGSDTRAMFGVPLTNDGQVLGVAYVGSSLTASFPQADKKLFLAVAERMSWAAAKYAERNRVQQVLEAAPALIAIVRGPEHVCEFSNPAFQSFFGVATIEGVRLSELGVTGAALDLIERVRGSGETVSARDLPIEMAARGDVPAETCFLDVTIQPLPGPVIEGDSLLVFAVDVTARVRARQEIDAHQVERARLLESERAAREEAELANGAKDQFLATVSHELRTPLNAIIGWTAVARAKAPPELERALSIIERNARAQARIIEDVLDISRTITGKLSLELRPTRVEESISSAAEAVRPAADAKGISLDVDVEVDTVISADADRLQQIVWNLLSNAIKFTPNGGRVSVHASRDSKRVRIQVTDTGQGIEREFLPHVFDPFRQADGTTTRRHAGLGLGLAIVKQLVVAHGGVVSAESQGPNAGSTFTVDLPTGSRVNVGSTMTSPITRGSVLEPVPDLRLDSLRVLVVDDEEDARELLREVLGGCGARVTTAGSMQEALETLAVVRPDVLVSDIGMPGGDGYALIRRVRTLSAELGGRTPAIALTAYARGEDVERAFAAGFQRHAEKPVDLHRFVSLVANLGGLSFGDS